MSSTFKDVATLLLLAFLLPVWIALGLGIVAVVVAGQVYRRARQHTTGLARVAARLSWSPRRRSTGRTRRARAGHPIPVVPE